MIWRFWGPLVSGSGPPLIQFTPAAHDDDIKRRAFVAAVDGDVH